MFKVLAVGLEKHLNDWTYTPQAKGDMVIYHGIRDSANEGNPLVTSKATGCPSVLDSLTLLPDVVFLDSDVLGHDPFRLIANIRAENCYAPLSNLPFVVWSNRLRARTAGRDDVCVTHEENHELVEKLCKYRLLSPYKSGGGMWESSAMYNCYIIQSIGRLMDEARIKSPAKRPGKHHKTDVASSELLKGQSAGKVFARSDDNTLRLVYATESNPNGHMLEIHDYFKETSDDRRKELPDLIAAIKRNLSIKLYNDSGISHEGEDSSVLLSASTENNKSITGLTCQTDILTFARILVNVWFGNYDMTVARRAYDIALARKLESLCPNLINIPESHLCIKQAVQIMPALISLAGLGKVHSPSEYIQYFGTPMQIAGIDAPAELLDKLHGKVIASWKNARTLQKYRLDPGLALLEEGMLKIKYPLAFCAHLFYTHAKTLEQRHYKTH